MSIRPSHLLLALACAAAAPRPAGAATYQGRSIDGRWYQARAVNTTYGAYDVEVRFSGERVLMRITSSGQQLVAILEDEAITDPHEVVAHDPPRGVDWTIDCFGLSR
jgi:hypothetical protein